jgi:hypothetical protein
MGDERRERQDRGRCLCGAVTFTVVGEAVYNVVCHCEGCRYVQSVSVPGFPQSVLRAETAAFVVVVLRLWADGTQASSCLFKQSLPLTHMVLCC